MTTGPSTVLDGRGLTRSCSAAFLLFALCGCTSLNDVSGVWCTPADSDPVTIPGTTPPMTARLKLAVEQYGKDVAGVLVLYDDPLFHHELDCWYVQDGEMIDSTFLFDASLFDASRAVQRVKGSFSMEEKDDDLLLVGTLWDPDNTRSEVEVVLERIGDRKLIRQEGWDQGCR